MSKNSQLPEVNPAKLKTYSIGDRDSKVGVEQLASPWNAGSGLEGLLASLPDVLAAKDLLAVAKDIAKARQNGKRVALGMGAHVIKVGLTPVLIDLIEQGVIGALLINGACLVHDFELAYAGKTSEDVAAVLGEGAFGMAEETGTLVNRMINDGVGSGLGLAESVGKAIAESDFQYKHLSLLAASYKAGIPMSCAVGVGTDILHMHSEADGGKIGEGSLADFRLFSRVVADLSGGVYINLGSAVLLPEVFLKALSVARNLGHPVENLTTVVMDFLQHYRARTNVQQRPTMQSGHGYYLVGHHEIMFPLLAAAVKLELADK